MSQATVNTAKLKTFGRIASSIVREWDQFEDKQLARQLLREGVRKLHETVTSARGKGKYLGHLYWSRAAVELLQQADGNVRKVTGKLSHEHVVPVDLTVDALVDLGKAATAERCIKVFQAMSLVAIITRAEQRLFGIPLSCRMPDGWKRGDDVWARYRVVNLYEKMVDHEGHGLP